MLESVIVTAALALPVANEPSTVCRNPIVTMLHDAGFQKHDLRAAWAITWRESHHQNLDESSPWYTGALGMWQIQTSAHSDKSWWSREAMLDPKQQSRIAYKYLTSKGTNWVHWGLGETKSGKFYMDTTLYGGWSGSQQYSWIWAPFVEGWDMFPNKCKSLL
jgi:hypothetical protein